MRLALLMALLAWPVMAQGSREQAQRDFEVGVELYEEGNYDGALVKFQRSYEASHNWKILYNVGQTLWMLHQYAEAMRAMEEYLTKGVGAIDEERLQEVRESLDKLRQRTSPVTLQVSPRGATVSVDGRHVGVAPLAEPLRLDVGTHRVTVRMEGETVERDVSVVGGEGLEVTITATLGPVGEAPAEDTPTPWYKTWWFWTSVGAGVALVAVGTALIVTNPFEGDKQDPVHHLVTP